jgi:hypothetical protein
MLSAVNYPSIKIYLIQKVTDNLSVKLSIVKVNPDIEKLKFINFSYLSDNSSYLTSKCD